MRRIEEKVKEFSYVNKHQRSDPLKKMQLEVAVEYKVLWVFYALLKKSVDYNGEKLL